MDEKKRRRVQLDLAPDALARLDVLRTRTGAVTRTEAVRNALRLYVWFHEEYSTADVITITANGTSVTVPVKMLLH